MKQGEPLSALIFSWRTHERRSWHLSMMALAAVLFVGGTLLLFQIVYPASRPLTLSPQRIWLLDPSLPGAGPIIAAAADKDFLLLGGTTPDATLPALEGQASAFFAPSFKGRTLQTKDLLEMRTTPPSLPLLFRPEHALLPALPQSGKPPPAALPSPRALELRAVVSHGLPGRAITRPVSLPATSVTADKSVAFYVAVAPAGQVKIILPLTGTAAQADTYRTLRAHVANLRFTPQNKQEIQWGTITFEWQEAAP